MFHPHKPKSQRNQVLTLLVATACALGLAGCSDSTSPKKAPSAAASSRTTKTPANTPSPSSTQVNASPLAGKTIVIDPGHGIGRQLTNPVPDGRGGSKICNTSGTATNAGYPEHTFTWQVADYLRTQLQEKGASVVMTRNNDTSAEICVDRRGQIPNEQGAAALISIHGNGSPSSAPHGFFVMVSDPPLNAAQGEPSRQLARAVSAGLQGTGLTPSTIFGAEPVSRSDLATLNFAQVPAVMVELGEMRNPEDAQRMSSPEGQQQYATGLAQGILSFFSAR